jgi:hypothetical protein
VASVTNTLAYFINYTSKSFIVHNPLEKSLLDLQRDDAVDTSVQTLNTFGFLDPFFLPIK